MLGNVGNLFLFRLGAPDAERLLLARKQAVTEPDPDRDVIDFDDR